MNACRCWSIRCDTSCLDVFQVVLEGITYRGLAAVKLIQRTLHRVFLFGRRFGDAEEVERAQHIDHAASRLIASVVIQS